MLEGMELARGVDLVALMSKDSRLADLVAYGTERGVHLVPYICKGNWAWYFCPDEDGHGQNAIYISVHPEWKCVIPLPADGEDKGVRYRLAHEYGHEFGYIPGCPHHDCAEVRGEKDSCFHEEERAWLNG